MQMRIIPCDGYQPMTVRGTLAASAFCVRGALAFRTSHLRMPSSNPAPLDFGHDRCSDGPDARRRKKNPPRRPLAKLTNSDATDGASVSSPEPAQSL